MENAMEKRWRLILGKEVKDELPGQLNTEEQGIDKSLQALYNSDRQGSLGSSSPNVARWLKDIREYFPKQVVQLLQKDALEKLNLTKMLTEPEMLETVVPDVHMVAELLSLGKLMPDKSKDTARQVVRKVVDELIQKLSGPTQQAIQGSLNRAIKNRRPRHNEIDWSQTIRLNLKHYQAEYKTVIPETRIGYGRKRRSLKDVILCLDQSGSMGTSVVYSGIFGAVMASIPSISTKMVVFDTAVVDLTEELQDPIDLLFGVQLGGGTDIHKALSYCEQIITRPSDTCLVLITDLYEGGDAEKMKRKFAGLVDAGVQIVTLLALNDEGAPYYCHDTAQFLASIGVSAFACTPELFPDLMAAALSNGDLKAWAGSHDIKTNFT